MTNGFSRPRLRRLAMFVLVAGAVAGCAEHQTQEDTQVDALLWATASAEYDVIARQIYYQAQRQLDHLLKQPHESAALEQEPGSEKLPPAIIVDVDETVLSNGLYHYQLLSEGKQGTEETWMAWMNEARGRPVPGAVDYLNYAASKGVAIFYLSNRPDTLYEATYRNLKQTGFPLDGKHRLLLREAGQEQADLGFPDTSLDKSPRRAAIVKQYRVVQVIGDGLGDFVGHTEQLSPQERRDLSSRYLAYWGEKWFMLPNPVYGDWENAILKTSGKPVGNDPLKAKYRFIRGGESQGVW